MQRLERACGEGVATVSSAGEARQPRRRQAPVVKLPEGPIGTGQAAGSNSCWTVSLAVEGSFGTAKAPGFGGEDVPSNGVAIGLGSGEDATLRVARETTVPSSRRRSNVGEPWSDGDVWDCRSSVPIDVETPVAPGIG